MVTLLLTFFVLIIAITSIDPKSLAQDEGEEFNLQRVNELIGPGALYFSNPSLMDPVVQLFQNLDRIPPEALLDQDEIKNAVFQLDPDPRLERVPFQELQEETRDSVSFFKDERGLVIRFDKAIFFPEGSTQIREENLILLGRLADLLSRLTLNVSIESHTNPLSEFEGGDSPQSFALASVRAKLILNYLLELGLRPSRFRLGAYGGAKPITTDPNLSFENSRVEIVLYQPAKSSWKG
jgi:flagellar motor protein MotB